MPVITKTREMKLRIIVFANGELEDPEALRRLIRPDDLIIAADGGALHCRNLGLKPSAVVGDLDSLPVEEQKRLETLGVEMLKYPARKDFTDLELALQKALESGAEEILIAGAMGGRWDMSMANVLLLASLDCEGKDVRLVDGRQEIMVLRGGGELTVRGAPGDVFSLMPLGSKAVGITLEGFEYPLVEATVKRGSTIGVSNVLTGNRGVVHLKEGLLLCFLTRAGGDA